MSIEYRITDSGQIVRRNVIETVVSNPDQILQALDGKLTEEAKAPLAAPTGAMADKAGNLISYHNLGEGVCAYQRTVGAEIITFGGVQLEAIPFFTNWEMAKDPDRPGKFFVCPYYTETGGFTMGNALNYTIPDDLVVHFFVEWHHDKNTNILTIEPERVHELPALLASKGYNFYLTAFSRSRNTCVRMPLPNSYTDCHLCTGNAFHQEGFTNPENHWGLTSSVHSFARAWADTGWNLHVIGDRHSRAMKQYRRFIRFDAATGKPLPFSGCDDWPLATSPVPLADVYAPWMTDKPPVRTTIKKGEEALKADGETLDPNGQQDEVERVEVAGEFV